FLSRRSALSTGSPFLNFISVIPQIQLVTQQRSARHRLAVAVPACPLAPQFTHRHLAPPGHSSLQRLAQIKIPLGTIHTRTSKPQRRPRALQIQVAYHLAVLGNPLGIVILQRHFQRLQPREFTYHQWRRLYLLSLPQAVLLAEISFGQVHYF